MKVPILQNPRLNCLWLVIVGILIIFPYDTSLAFDKDFFVSGFVSQGFLVTSDNTFLVDKSVEGSFEFNEAAITIQANLSDRLRVGIQLLALDRGDEGNNQVLIDWAGGDYHWRDCVGIRAGKIKMPLGMYNQGRDIDMLRTTIFMPQSVYAEQMRDFTLANEGVSIYGNASFRHVGNFDYEIYGGTLNVPDPTRGFWGDIFVSSGYGIIDGLRDHIASDRGIPDTSVTVNFNGSADQRVSFPVVYGGSLIWNTPLTGLRLGNTWFVGEFDMRGRWNYTVSVQDTMNSYPESFPLDIVMDEEFEIDKILSISADYSWQGLTAAAELSSSEIDHGPKKNRSEGYYGQITYQFCPWLTLASYYSVYYPNADSKDGDYYVALGYSEYTGWQKDFAFSTRIDVTPNWLMKAEFHYVDGVGQLSEVDNRDLILAGTSQRYWTLFALKTTYHF